LYVEQQNQPIFYATMDEPFQPSLKNSTVIEKSLHRALAEFRLDKHRC